MNIKNIVIYGVGVIGVTLYEELKFSSIKVLSFIDKLSLESKYYEDIPIRSIDDINLIQNIDVIIVTPVYDFEVIKKELTKRGFNKVIISLEDLIFLDYQ